MENKNETSYTNDMPLGFSFSLAANQHALEKFAGMNDTEKKQVLETARTMRSKEQMENFINNIAQL